MAKIVWPMEFEREWELGPFSMTIGCKPDNGIIVDDPLISARHAQVCFANGRHYLEDLNSDSGTFINGAPVTRSILSDGDVIQIGRQYLTFVDPPAAGRGDEDDAGGLLDQLVGSIRSHRIKEQIAREEAQARLRAEWEKTMVHAEQLRRRVEGDSRVVYFAVSRRNNDIIIRTQRRADMPVLFVHLSMEHPDNQSHALVGIWLRRSNTADRCYDTAKEVLSELLRDLAFLLA